MEENATKIITILATVVLAILVIGIVFSIFNKSKSSINSAMGDLDNMNTQLAESDFTQYDNTPVTGTDVLNVINKYKNTEIAIGVNAKKTQTTPNWYYYQVSGYSKGTGLGTLGSEVSNTTEALKKAKSKSDGTYINPNATFMGEVIRDTDNKAIIGLVFSLE